MNANQKPLELAHNNRNVLQMNRKEIFWMEPPFLNGYRSLHAAWRAQIHCVCGLCHQHQGLVVNVLLYLIIYLKLFSKNQPNMYRGCRL